MQKLNRISEAKNKFGSRNDRKLKKYSDKFNKMFNFYLDIVTCNIKTLNGIEKGIIDFCGSEINIDFDINGSDAKFAFREYDNGRFKNQNPISRHSNILHAVIIGKKGWGLWIEQWSQGINEWCFTKEEILKQFTDQNIIIPDSLMIEWDKLIEKKRQLRINNYLNKLN